MPVLEFAFTDGSHLHSMSALKLSQTAVWEANRHLDEQHVEALSVAADPRTLQGLYSIVTYRATSDAATDSNLLIDGQHRQAVLKRYFAANPTAEDFQVLCRRYFPADHAAAVGIFKAINTAKPMPYAGSSLERLHEIQKALQRAFIADKAGGKSTILIRENCNRPYLNMSHLAEAIKRNGLHERQDLHIADIVSYAEKMNAWYADDLNRLTVKGTAKIYQKAQELNFYLGLDPQCGWLVGLCR
jgi:hypothetical protein